MILLKPPKKNRCQTASTRNKSNKYPTISIISEEGQILHPKHDFITPSSAKPNSKLLNIHEAYKHNSIKFKSRHLHAKSNELSIVTTPLDTDRRISTSNQNLFLNNGSISKKYISIPERKIEENTKTGKEKDAMALICSRISKQQRLWSKIVGCIKNNRENNSVNYCNSQSNTAKNSISIREIITFR